MSRSRHSRHVPGYYQSWVCYFSNKKDKQKANRLFRRRNNILAHQATISGDDEEFLHNIRETSDVWDFASDGLAEYFVREEEDRDNYKLTMK